MAVCTSHRAECLDVIVGVASSPTSVFSMGSDDGTSTTTAIRSTPIAVAGFTPLIATLVIEEDIGNGPRGGRTAGMKGLQQRKCGEVGQVGYGQLSAGDGRKKNP